MWLTMSILDKSARVVNDIVNRSHSQSQSCEVQSSMETVPTDFVDGFGSGEEETIEEPWGRLFPIGTSFTSLGGWKQEKAESGGRPPDARHGLGLAT